MRFIELTLDNGGRAAVNVDLVTCVVADTTDYTPNCNTGLCFVNEKEPVHFREPYTEVMALLQGTATAEQATAERADLDERLAALERKGTLNDGLQHMNESMILEMASRIGKTEARLTLLGGVDIAVLEDSIGGVSKRQGEMHSDVCGLADRIKQVEDGLRGLRRQVMGQEGRDYGERP